jgi:hypothetical protein
MATVMDFARSPVAYSPDVSLKSALLLVDNPSIADDLAEVFSSP